ncbi:MAG: YhbY family RNA-binding protein [Ruminobacter sp.]|nr:YhbY family RNA-binding protein [Ruminobacter sp.]
MTSKERARLKGLAANEDTIVQVGKGGITAESDYGLNVARINAPKLFPDRLEKQ